MVIIELETMTPGWRQILLDNFSNANETKNYLLTDDNIQPANKESVVERDDQWDLLQFGTHTLDFLHLKMLKQNMARHRPISLPH